METDLHDLRDKLTELTNKGQVRSRQSSDSARLSA